MFDLSAFISTLAGGLIVALIFYWLFDRLEKDAVSVRFLEKELKRFFDDVHGLKEEVRLLKEDVEELKGKVEALRADIDYLRREMP